MRTRCDGLDVLTTMRSMSLTPSTTPSATHPLAIHILYAHANLVDIDTDALRVLHSFEADYVRRPDAIAATLLPFSDGGVA